MEAIPVAQPVKEPTHHHLRTRVTGPDCLHRPSTLFLGTGVHRSIPSAISVVPKYDNPLGRDGHTCRSPARPGVPVRPTRPRHLHQSGQVRHLRAQPLDLPLQGFDLLPQGFDVPGVPPLFRFVLRGQPLQGGRQLSFQIGHAAPYSLSRQLQVGPPVHGEGRTARSADGQHRVPLPADLPQLDAPGRLLQLRQGLARRSASSCGRVSTSINS